MIIIEPLVWLFRANGEAILRNPSVNLKRKVQMTISGMVETEFIFILTDRLEFYYSKWFGHFRTVYAFFEMHMLFSYWKMFFRNYFTVFQLKRNFRMDFYFSNIEKNVRTNSHYSNRYSLFEWILFE